MKNNKKHYQEPIKPTAIAAWGYRCYVDDRGNDIIDEWKKSLSPKARANFDSTLKILKDQPKSSWLRPNACAIGDNIFVIHFKDENRSQYRPTGNFLDNYNSFVITTKVIERDGKYIPSNYAVVAATRRDEVSKSPDARSKSCFAHVSIACLPSSHSKGMVRS